MVWRSRVMCTRSSRAASSAGDGRAHLHGARRVDATVRRRGSGALDRGHHVALGDAAVLAGARNGRRHRRRLPPTSCAPTAAPACRLPVVGVALSILSCARGLSSACDGLAADGCSPRSARPLARQRRRPAAFLDLAEQRADRDGLAVLRPRSLRQHAGGGRRHFDRHLVGFELDQRLVDGDGVARLLEPLADGRLGDGFAEGRNADLGHRISILSSS